MPNKFREAGKEIPYRYFNSSRASHASERSFDEPIGSARGMPQGGPVHATGTAGGYNLPHRGCPLFFFIPHQPKDLLRFRGLSPRRFPARQKSGPHHGKQSILRLVIFPALQKLPKAFSKSTYKMLTSMCFPLYQLLYHRSGIQNTTQFAQMRELCCRKSTSPPIQ